jgi:hypothetical protein
MKPILILVLLPVLIGVVANTLFRRIRSATFAATIGAPIVVYFCLWALDPDGTESETPGTARDVAADPGSRLAGIFSRRYAVIAEFAGKLAMR